MLAARVRTGAIYFAQSRATRKNNASRAYNAAYNIGTDAAASGRQIRDAKSRDYAAPVWLNYTARLER